MRFFFLLFTILFFFGCNKDIPEKSTVIFVINNVSYNLTLEAYEDLSAYLIYLEEYYAGEENLEEIIKVL